MPSNQWRDKNKPVPAGAGTGLAGAIRLGYPRSWRASWGRLLAWASMDTAAWVMMLFLVNSVISRATSTSLMRDSADWRFSAWTCRLVMVFFQPVLQGAEAGPCRVLGVDGRVDLG